MFPEHLIVKDNLTPFQRAALNKIRHAGGTLIYDPGKRSWGLRTLERFYIPSQDCKTEGFIGWPTVNALMAYGYLKNVAACVYELK